MAKTPEIPIPIPKSYGTELLLPQIKTIGRDRIAKLAGVDKSTVHRNINEGNLTYTTATKLIDAIRAAHAEDGSPSPKIPPPVTPVYGAMHYELCQLGERMVKHPGLVEKVLARAIELVQEAEREEMLDPDNLDIRRPK